MVRALLCVRLWAAAALLSRLALAVGPVVRCEPCDARALEACKPPAAECAEPVREPGCGCCLTCALPEGRPCGVYTERCGAGLSCRPPAHEPKPLQALLDGKGLCTNVSADAAAAGGAAAGGGSGGGGGGGAKLRDVLLLRGSPGPGKPAERRGGLGRRRPCRRLRPGGGESGGRAPRPAAISRLKAGSPAPGEPRSLPETSRRRRELGNPGRESPPRHVCKG